LEDGLARIRNHDCTMGLGKQFKACVGTRPSPLDRTGLVYSHERCWISGLFPWEFAETPAIALTSDGASIVNTPSAPISDSAREVPQRHSDVAVNSCRSDPQSSAAAGDASRSQPPTRIAGFGWCPQIALPTTEANRPPPVIDFALIADFRALFDAGLAGPLPVIIVEATLNDPPAKLQQLKLYAMNCCNLWHHDVPPVMLGMVLGPSSATVVAFSRSERKLCHTVLLNNVPLASDSFRRFTLCVPEWSRLMTEYVSSPKRYAASRPTANVCVMDGKVYKSFDYAGRTVPDADRRRYELNLLCIDGAQLLPRSLDVVPGPVITYPYLQGSHIPRRMNQVIAVLQAVQALHERKGIIHGDLRWLNVVIASNSDLVTLIDFDMAAVGDIKTAKTAFAAHALFWILEHFLGRVYPSGLTLELPDGVRHPNAKGGCQLMFEHDVYACGGLLSLVCSDDSKVAAVIKDTAGALMHADCPITLSAAIENLQSCALSEVRIVARLPVHCGTGSPPRPGQGQ